MRLSFVTFLAAVLTAAGLAGCDFSEQNVDWEPGGSLVLVGPVDEAGGAIDAGTTETGVPIVHQPVDAYFYISGFTVEQEYTWTVNGNAPSDMENAAILNDGEFLRLQLTAPGTYVVEVSSGGMSGTQEIVVQNPPA